MRNLGEYVAENLYTHRRRCKSKNSQAKGLDSDEALESGSCDCRLSAPTKQLDNIIRGIFQVK